MVNVLLIDDDVQAHKTFRMIMPETYRIISAFSGEHGLEILEKENPDVILLDVNLPAKSGHEILSLIMEKPLAPPVIMLSAVSDVASVVRSIRLGAHDYVTKPYDVKKLEGTMLQAIANAGQYSHQVVPKNMTPLASMIGESKAMRDVREMVVKCAASHAPVIVQGASGTGKELVARCLHALSGRSEGPFIALNCGAIPSTLIETELFGSERGAYTDARSRPGSFERAHGGTLFLDEIGEMPPEAQVKLLRVCEEKQVVRVGGSDVIHVNVRVVAATNRNLKAMVDEGLFREDLYYRISVLAVNVPELKERREDIVFLALYFLSAISDKSRRLADDAREKLINHSWPGNVRELRNVMERALVFAQGDCIRASDIVF